METRGEGGTKEKDGEKQVKAIKVSEHDVLGLKEALQEKDW